MGLLLTSCFLNFNIGSGNEARQCTNTDERIYDRNAVTDCDEGKSITCISQIPITIDCSENIGFAFADNPWIFPNEWKIFLINK